MNFINIYVFFVCNYTTLSKVKIYYDSPLGTILLEGSDKGLTKLVFVDEMSSNEKTGPENQDDLIDNNPEMTSNWISRLDDYFNHRLTVFDLELDLKGTEFQKKVWKELLNIPFGRTVTYKELTLRLGDIKAIRAVAAANGANPVSIIVPCHRVLGSDGSLTGYAGGLWRKQWLLDFERGVQTLDF